MPGRAARPGPAMEGHIWAVCGRAAARVQVAEYRVRVQAAEHRASAQVAERAAGDAGRAGGVRGGRADR